MHSDIHKCFLDLRTCVESELVTSEFCYRQRSVWGLQSMTSASNGHHSHYISILHHMFDIQQSKATFWKSKSNPNDHHSVAVWLSFWFWFNTKKVDKSHTWIYRFELYSNVIYLIDRQLSSLVIQTIALWFFIDCRIFKLLHLVFIFVLWQF